MLGLNPPVLFKSDEFGGETTDILVCTVLIVVAEHMSMVVSMAISNNGLVATKPCCTLYPCHLYHLQSLILAEFPVTTNSHWHGASWSSQVWSLKEPHEHSATLCQVSRTEFVRSVVHYFPLQMVELQ